MSLYLAQYLDHSTVTLKSADGRFRRIQYTQPTHKYRSETDYQTLVTELRTYGDRAVSEVFDYLANTRTRSAA